MESAKADRIQCPTFSGDESEYSLWWLRFGAFAAVNGFTDVILSEENRHAAMPGTYADGDAIDDKAATATADEKLAKKIWKQNSLAVSYLTLAFKAPSLLRMLESAKTTGYPYGETHLVIKALKSQYRPQDMVIQSGDENQDWKDFH